MGTIRRVVALHRSGLDLSGDTALSHALSHVNRLRGLVPDALADAAAEASYVIFEKPEREARAEQTTQAVDDWLHAAERDPATLPADMVAQLAESESNV